MWNGAGLCPASVAGFARLARKHLSFSTGLAGAITAHAGLSNLRLHDLRHSYASIGAAAGMGLGTVGKLLGHASPTTTARYSHFADDPLRRASESISETIAAAMNATTKRETNIIEIPKKVR